MKERIEDILKEITGVANPSELSLSEIKAKLENYLKEMGLSVEEINNVRSVLCD